MFYKNIFKIKSNKPEGNKELPVQKALFNIYVNTEKWDEGSKTWKYGSDFLSVNYSLEIIVDEHFSEDGKLLPVINSIPVYYFFNKTYPIIEELIGKTIDTPDEVCDWDAWLGNDAPKLTNNKISFSKWDKNQIYLTWKAQFGEELETICFEGGADFEGIGIKVKQSGDEDEFIKQLFGERLNDWEKSVGEWTDYGDSMPADRRKWLNFKINIIK